MCECSLRVTVCAAHEGRGLACGDQPPAQLLWLRGELSDDAAIQDVESCAELISYDTSDGVPDHLRGPRGDGGEDAWGRFVPNIWGYRPPKSLMAQAELRFWALAVVISD